MTQAPYGQRVGNQPIGSAFRSKYGGTCRRCGGSIAIGQMVRSAGKSRGITHTVCLLPGTVTPDDGTADMADYVQLRATAPARDRRLVKSLQSKALPQSDRPDDQEGGCRS